MYRGLRIWHLGVLYARSTLLHPTRTARDEKCVVSLVVMVWSETPCATAYWAVAGGPLDVAGLVVPNLSCRTVDRFLFLSL